MADQSFAEVNRNSRCPYCGGGAVLHVSSTDRNRRTSDVVFHVFRCTSCGLQFVFNPPGDLGQYYPIGYHGIPQDKESFERGLVAQQFKLDILQQYALPGALLEIGPSIGMFCALAKRAQFDVSAIEMDSDCARFLRDTLDVRTVQSDDPASVLATEERYYDAICFWHSLEHLPYPWTVLEQACHHLKPNGILIIAAPNPLGRQARIMGRRWPHYDLPRHLFGFPIPWMLAFAQKSGLNPELVTTQDPGSLAWNRFSWASLLTNWIQLPRFRPYVWRLGLLLGYVLQPWEGKEGHGATYTIILRRPA